MTDLLSHLVSLLKDQRLVTRISKSFAMEETRSKNLRLALSRITNQIFSVPRQFPQRPKGKSNVLPSASLADDKKSPACARICFPSF